MYGQCPSATPPSRLPTTPPNRVWQPLAPVPLQEPSVEYCLFCSCKLLDCTVSGCFRDRRLIADMSGKTPHQTKSSAVCALCL